MKINVLINTPSECYGMSNFYGRYMDEANTAKLESFANIISASHRTKPFSTEELQEILPEVDAILSLNGAGTREINQEVLSVAKRLKVAVVAHWWHNAHNAMTPIWKSEGITVIDASDACNRAVAEWTVGAMIVGLRRFYEFNRDMHNGVAWPAKSGPADELLGARVGLLGLGRCGVWVTKYVLPFGPEIVAYDPYFPKDKAEALGITLLDLHEVLATSDVVSVHLPVLPETKGLIGEKEFQVIKKGALFLNCARAEVLDNEAFYKALEEKRIHAFIDVFNPEPPPLDSILRKLDNVVMTPHIAGGTDRMFRNCGRFAIDALKDYVSNNT